MIALGFPLAHRGVLGEDTQMALSHLVHFVATPALLIDLLSRTDVSQALGIGFAIAALSVLVVLVVCVPGALLAFGISLRSGGRLGSTHRAEIAGITLLKVVHASRFGRSELVARDSIAVTTVACIPLFFGFAALLA